MVALWLLICPPVVIAVGFTGLVIAIYGSVERSNKYTSIGLLLFGATLAVVSAFLIPLVGWHDTDVSPEEDVGRVVMIAALLAGVALSFLGILGLLLKDFFWKPPKVPG